jgi:CRP-like cAMP-binding protein
MRGGVIGLVGLQGVSKSNALLAIEIALMLKKQKKVKKDTDEPSNDSYDYRVLCFKWQRQQQLFANLLNGTHPLSLSFRRKYAGILLSELKSTNSQCFSFYELSEVKRHPETLNLKWIEKPLGQRTMRSLLPVAWRALLREQEAILIDTPDYSRTDRRSMVKDLDEIYSLWDTTSSIRGENPIFVVAIQKELCQGHFFFGRMDMIELAPLTPIQMRSAYVQQFKSTWPFTEDALLTLARMSRGVFRRYLRYITLSLDLWESRTEGSGEIDVRLVDEAVPFERVCEDMSLELAELFPKNSELKEQAAKVLIRLGERGGWKQTELAKDLDMEAYSLSRILSKLEAHRYVSRKRDGKDKIVSLPENTSSASQSPSRSDSNPSEQPEK